MMLLWLADALRGAGLTVVEHDGWKTRYRPGDWSPRYGVVHATAAPATQSDDVQVRIVRDGRSDLPGPIAVAVVDRRARWHVVGSGRCNTTIVGTDGPYEGLGNTYAIGVEACNDNNTEPWPDDQYRSYVIGWAAICKRLGWKADRLVGHKEHTPGHKTDPTFSMDQFRRDVAAALAGTFEEDDMDAKQAQQLQDLWYSVGRYVPVIGGQPGQTEALTYSWPRLVALVQEIAARVDISPDELAAIAAAVPQPPDAQDVAARTAEMVVARLGADGDLDVVEDLIRAGLTPEQVADLAARLATPQP